MLKLEPREVSWVQYFHDQAVDSREYVKRVADQIPAEIRDALLSIVRWAEETERACDEWCDINHKQCYEEIRLNMFLEEQIKALLAAIRATKHADSIPALREAARDSGNRIRAWKYEAEQKRLQAEGFVIARHHRLFSHKSVNSFAVARPLLALDFITMLAPPTRVDFG